MRKIYPVENVSANKSKNHIFWGTLTQMLQTLVVVLRPNDGCPANSVHRPLTDHKQ